MAPSVRQAEARLRSAFRFLARVPQHAWLRGGGALLGLILILMAVPRTDDAWALARARHVIAALEQGQAVPAPLLAETRGRLTRIAESDPSGRSHAVLATLDLAEAAANPADQIVAMLSAENHLKAALSRRPADTVWWARLAHARYRLAAGRADAGTRAALRRSFDTGLREAAPMGFRLQLSLRAWDDLDADLRGAAAAQIAEMSRSWELSGLLARIYQNSEPAARPLIRLLIDAQGASPKFLDWHLAEMQTPPAPE